MKIIYGNQIMILEEKLKEKDKRSKSVIGITRREFT
jgi:hypothetical protein